MRFSKASTSIPVWTGAILLSAVAWLAVLPGAACSGESAGGDDGRGILRLDPFNQELVPVSPDEVKVGYIYSYYNSRLNRRVWSFVQSNGELWRAFGPGTTQLARRLDLRVSEKTAMQRVATQSPELAQELDRTGGPVYIRLGDDNQWHLTSYGAMESIFDIERGRRWEWYRNEYLPVAHTLGYRWRREGQGYVPVPRYHPSLLFAPR